MSDGCICCTLGGDLEDKVDELAENRNLDYLIVEGSGVALPMHVAANLFDSAPEDGGLVRLDTMVTVVDTHRFLNDVMSAESLSDKGMGEGQHDDRTVADILVEQVRSNFPLLRQLESMFVYGACLSCLKQQTCAQSGTQGTHASRSSIVS